MAGASFFYQPGSVPYEAQEVRAYGLFMADVVARSHMHEGQAAGVRDGLAALADSCVRTPARQRPAFAKIVEQLEAMQSDDS